MCFGAIAASIGGSLVSGLLSNKGASDANAASASSVKQQQDFQERMSNTSYQRGMADMQKAGINPMLAYMKGGASTPEGASYTAQNTWADGAKEIGAAVPTAVTLQNVKANTAKSIAEAGKATADTDLSSAQAAETRARTPTYASNIALNQAQTTKIGYEIPKILVDSNLSRIQIDKIGSEILNLAKTGNLTDAQVNETLSRANLNTAQIREVTPRINKLVADTQATNFELPLHELKGAISDRLNLPKIISNSAKSSDETSAGTKLYDFFHPSSAERNARRVYKGRDYNRNPSNSGEIN